MPKHVGFLVEKEEAVSVYDMKALGGVGVFIKYSLFRHRFGFALPRRESPRIPTEYDAGWAPEPWMF